MTSGGASATDPNGGVRSDHNILATAKGWGLLAGGQIFQYTTRFVIVLILAHSLGVEKYGLYVLALATAGLFTGVALLGLDDAMVRYVAILSRRRDRGGVWGTMQIGLGISLLAGLAMAAALFLGANFLAQGTFHEPRLATLLRLAAAVVPFFVATDVLSAIARGFRRMDYSAFGETIVPSILRLVLVAVAALVGQLNAQIAVVFFGVSELAASITFIVLLNRQFPMRGVFRHDTRRELKQVFGFALPLWLSDLLSRFRRNLLTLTLGSLSSAFAVGIFSVAARVNDLGHVAFGTITVSIRPIIAQLHDRKERQALAHLYTTATRWTLMLNLPVFLIMALYPVSLLALIGKGFRSGATALVIMAFSELVNAATGICGSMIDMTGHARLKLANSILWIVLLVGSGALLIPVWGVIGAASAMLISTAIVNVVVVIEVWVLERLLPFEWKLWKPVAAGVAALTVGWLLRLGMPVGDNWRRAAVQAAIVVATYSGLLLGFRLEREDRLVIQRTVKKAISLAGRVGIRPRVAAGGLR
jgi:O-antigen/teichoic acid export membrane protein